MTRHRLLWALAAGAALGAAGTAVAPRPATPPPRPITPIRPATPGTPIRPGAPGGIPGWHPSAPAAPRARPDAVMRDVRAAIQVKPAEAFGRLQQGEARLLSRAQRLTLAREAVERLAVQVEAGGNAARNLADVRAARRSAAGLE